MRLGDVQVFVLGLMLDVADPPDAELLGAVLSPTPADAEAMLDARVVYRLRLEERPVEDLWRLHGLFGQAANMADDQLEHGVGRGANAESRPHLREERRAAEALGGRVVAELRRRGVR